MTAFVDTMAYVGATPWHGLGEKLPADAPSAEVIAAAGLDWKVEKAALYDGAGREVPGIFGMRRSDTGTCFEDVAVGSRYVPFQNAELFAFGDALRGAGGVKWHTAGSLKGGRRVWTLAQCAGQFEVRRRSGESDVTAPFLLLTSSHDGRSSIVVQFTSVRVVCWNTLSAALGQRGAVSFTARHTASAAGRAADAADALGLAASHFEREREVMQALADATMRPEHFAAFTAQLLTGEDDAEKALDEVRGKEGRSRSMIDRKARELAALWVRGDGNSGADRYDALNAVTQWVDRGPVGSGFGSDLVSELADAHFRREGGKVLDVEVGKRAKRLESAWFGNGASVKARALELLAAPVVGTVA